MTDFLAWWADHWPLVPFVVLVILMLLPQTIFWWTIGYQMLVKGWRKRRREP